RPRRSDIAICTTIRSARPPRKLALSSATPAVIIMGNERDWIAYEWYRDILFDVWRRLETGGEGAGATLTAGECANLAASLKTSPSPRVESIRTYCFALEGSKPL